MSTEMDRRGFLQGAAVGVAALAGAGALAACTAKSGAESDTDKTVTTPPKKKNRVCELLGIEKPVISAPMYYLTDATFCAAVSEAGGLGMLNGTTLGTDNSIDGFHNNDKAAQLKNLKDEIIKLRSLTKKPFAVACPNIPGLVDLLLEYTPAAVSGGFSPAEWDQLKAAGVKQIGGNQGSTLDDLKKAEADGADLLYLKCYGCGGSIPRNSRRNVAAQLQWFMDNGLTKPMLAAGGIVNSAGAAAAGAAGAEGLWVGTRFLVTNESPAHAKTKQAIIDLKANDMIEWISASYSYCHSNKSPKALYFAAFGGNATDAVLSDHLNTYLQGMRLGDLENWFLSVNDSVDSITEMKTCKEIVDDLGDALLKIRGEVA